MVEADQRYVRIWEIPIGAAWITVALSAPKVSEKHSGARLAAQGEAIRQLGTAIQKIRNRFNKTVKAIDTANEEAAP